jgi:hypothetical protein
MHSLGDKLFAVYMLAIIAVAEERNMGTEDGVV